MPRNCRIALRTGERSASLSFAGWIITHTITVDPQTKLPIRMEVIYPNNLDKGQAVEMREVYTDFVFDAPIDECFFESSSRLGYTVENHIPPDVPAQPPTSVELVVSPDDGIGPVRSSARRRPTSCGYWASPIGGATSVLIWWREPGVKPGSKLPTIISAVELNYHRRGFSVMTSDRLGMYSIHRFGSAVWYLFRQNQGGHQTRLVMGGCRSSKDGKPQARLESTHAWYKARL